MSSTIKLKPVEVTENTSIVDINRLYALQQLHRHKQGLISVEDRLKKLKLLQRAILAHRMAFQESMFKDYNKPAPEVDMAELFPILHELKLVIRKLKSWTGKHRVGTPWFLLGAASYIHYEAKGHCLILAPWNFPIHLTLLPLIYSYAAGNVTMIKPSEFTPYTSVLVKKIIQEIFFEEEAAVVNGNVDVSTHILALKFNHIFFTGSPKVGKIVMKAAAEHLCSVTLELGGKSPMIIDPSADLALASTYAGATKFVNGGQYCIAPDYFYVHTSIKDEFIKKVIQQIKLSYGADDSALLQGHYSHMVNGAHTARILAHIEDAKQKGATLIYRWGEDSAQDFIGPVIFTDTTQDMTICTEEIFGPIILIKTFDVLQEVVDEVNKGEKPLSLYLFSRSAAVNRRIRKEISAGGMDINSVGFHYYNYNLPFGGVNNSGIGKSHGFYSFQEFTNAKSIFNQWWPWPSGQLMFPPFNKMKQRMIDFLIKMVS